MTAVVFPLLIISLYQAEVAIGVGAPVAHKVLAFIGISLTFSLFAGNKKKWLLLSLFSLLAVYFSSMPLMKTMEQARQFELQHSSKKKIWFKNSFEGELCEKPRYPAWGQLDLVICGVTASGIKAVAKVSTAAVPWNELSRAKKGDVLRVEGKFRSVFKRWRKEYSIFSYDGYLYLSGVSLVGKDIEGFILSPRVFDAKPGFTADLIQNLGDSDALAITLAVVTGQRDLLAKSTKYAFRDTGLAHVLVVSGFHVGIVYMASWCVFGWLFRRSSLLLSYLSADVPTAFLSLLTCVLYVNLVGASPTVLRALIVVTFVALGVFFGRKPHSVRVLLLSAIVVLLVWPGIFLHAGFQLTYSALTGLYLMDRLFKLFKERFENYPKIFLAPFRTLFACFGAWLFTAPVVLIWFDNIVAMSPLVNALLVFPLCLLAVCGGGLCIILIYFSVPGALKIFELLLSVLELLVSQVIYLSKEFKYRFPGKVYLDGDEKYLVLSLLLIAIVGISYLIYYLSSNPGKKRKKAIDQSLEHLALVDSEEAGKAPLVKAAS